jgi:hypothetical protein
MPKMRERCARLFGSRPIRRVARTGLLVAALVAVALPASAATRRIALVHAEPDLERSVDLALYPWDIKVVTIEDAPPDGNAPGAAAEAKAIAQRHDADAIAWLVQGSDAAAPTLWFFDTTTLAIQSHPLPSLPSNDPAELAAVALTLKTLVRAAQWEQRSPPDVPEEPGVTWETRLELEAMGRSPSSGASAEPRAGLWASEWRGTPRLRLGAGLGASAGLGTTFDGETSHGSLHDIDARADLRASIQLGWHLDLEARLGASAHIERAQVTTTSPAATQTLSRVNPSLDLGLFLAWEVTRRFVWSIGVEGLDSLRYQRWLSGNDVVFAPSPLWIQAGSSLAWRFR